MKLSLLSALVLGLLSSPAFALKLSIVGVGNLSSPEPRPSFVDYTAEGAFGGGGLMELGLLPTLGLEFGALYAPRKFSYNTSPDVTVTKTMNMVQIPVVLRATLGGVLSLGLGGYYALYNSDQQTEVKSDRGTVLSTSSYLLNNHEETDYGIVTSLALYVPFTPLSRFVLDGRYNMGVKDNDLGPNETKYNDIQILAGIQLGM